MKKGSRAASAKSKTKEVRGKKDNERKKDKKDKDKERSKKDNEEIDPCKLFLGPYHLLVIF